MNEPAYAITILKAERERTVSRIRLLKMHSGKINLAAALYPHRSYVAASRNLQYRKTLKELMDRYRSLTNSIETLERA